MQINESKELPVEKHRTGLLLGRIFTGALLISLTGFLMYAILVGIMYFI